MNSRPDRAPISYAQARALYESARARGDTKAANQAAADMQAAAQKLGGQTP